MNKRIKRRYLSLLAVATFPLLASWSAPSGSVSMRIYSYTDYVVRSNGEQHTGSLGHSFVVFYNNTQSSKTIGHYTLKANDTLSVGL